VTIEIMNKMTIEEIRKHLPHRYPFLLIDAVTSYEPEKSITAIKNVTINEPFFQGHFPIKPIMPGVLIIEAMAQAAALLGCVSRPAAKEGTLYYLVGLDNTRFKKTVGPGDQLVLEVNFEKERRNIWKFNAKATVNSQIVAMSDLLTTVMEPDS
jgi:3-hydroxyacyl-[acyl-carrier-protein] dehydratase